MLHKEHGRLRAEMEAREGDFAALAEAGEQMLAANHYADQDIRQKMEQVCFLDGFERFGDSYYW